MFNRFRKLVLFLLGLSIPVQGFALNLVAMQATPFKLGTALLLVLAGLQYAMRMGGRPPDRKNFAVIAFGLSYLVAVSISIVAGLPAVEVIRQGTSMVALISFYLLLSYAVQDRDDLMLLLWALVLGGAITVIPAALGLQQAAQEAGSGRATGLAGQENTLGAEMNVCFAVAVGLFFLSRSTFRKTILVGCGALALAGVALSLSRSAFVALGVMWLFWLYRTGGRRGSARYAVIAAVVGLVGLVFVPESVVERATTIVDPVKRKADQSIQGRFLLNEWALRAFMSNPVVGVGAHRFPFWVHEQPQPEARRVPWHSVHNAYLGIAAEQGLFGLIPFVLLIALSWGDYSRCWRAIRARRMIRDPDLEALGVLALFLQLALLAGIITAFFHQGQRSKSFWMVMALSPVLVALVHARLLALLGPSGDQARVDDFREIPDGLAGPSPIR